MGRKAQIIIIILWILVILTIMAVGAGHRVSMALRLARYQRGGLKALSLAEAGINRAIIELEKDQHSNDHLREAWSTGIDLTTNKALFENIEVKEGSGEKFNVKYYHKDSDRHLAISDEERKININTADIDLLRVLLEECGVRDIEEIAKNILFWRGWAVADPPDYTGLGYKNKGARFENIEELILVEGVKEIEPENLEKIMALITVFSDGKVNINTAGEEVLGILIGAAVTKLQNRNAIINASADELKKIILEYRETDSFSDINAISSDLDLTQEQKSDFNNIINELKSMISVKSQNFRIISTGETQDGGVERAIECVYGSDDKKVVFWHES